MKKNKKYIIVIVVILAIVAFLAISRALSMKNDGQGSASAGEAILFYGDGCPHCENVEEYMAGSGVKERYSFQELEVYNNQTNAKLLAKIAKDCGLDSSQGIGVPFFFDGSQCYIGDQPIIDYLKQK